MHGPANKGPATAFEKTNIEIREPAAVADPATQVEGQSRDAVGAFCGGGATDSEEFAGKGRSNDFISVNA